MRIGIDLDDTICRTTEKVHEYLEEFAKKKELTSIDIMNDEALKAEFFTEYIGEIYQTVEIKRSVEDVLRHLKEKGNKLYMITARRPVSLKGNDIQKITLEWLKKNHITIDGLFMNCYGEEKATICKENQIDLMIDDDPYNYQKIITSGIPCILFDDRGRYNLKDHCLTSWLAIERYIERNY